jgi:hypothetical protein
MKKYKFPKLARPINEEVKFTKPEIEAILDRVESGADKARLEKEAALSRIAEKLRLNKGELTRSELGLVRDMVESRMNGDESDTRALESAIKKINVALVKIGR